MRKHTSPYRNQKPGSSLGRVLFKPEYQTRNNSKEKKTTNISPIRFVLNSRHNSFEQNTKPPQTQQSVLPSLSRKHFQLQYVIGIGGFGKVWKVIYKSQYYAMKEMSKALVIYKRSVISVINELRLLQNLNHQFIVNVVAAFQDKYNIYLVLDYLQGGDLRYHLGRNRRFNEEQTKFIICCVIVGLEYLHSNHIIHRDLKPENLVLDSKGYVRITDLGVARKLDNLNIDTIIFIFSLKLINLINIITVQVELQGIWHRKLCVDQNMVYQQIIILWELQHMNQCLGKDLIMDKIEKKQEIIFLLNKLKQNRNQKVGLWMLLILSIN